jgi:hypothetical protein
VFALEPQWRTPPELSALERVGTNRVVLSLLRPDLNGILEEMDELARTVLRLADIWVPLTLAAAHDRV